LEATTIIIIIAALVAALLIFGGFVLAPQLTGRTRSQQRIKQLTSGEKIERVSRPKNKKQGRKSAGRRRDIQARLRDVDEAKKEKPSRTHKYRQDIRRSGLPISLQQFFIICGGLFVLACIGYIFMDLPVIGIIPFGLTVGFGLPLWTIRFLGRRRTAKFILLFADAMDVIIRGIRSGLPVGECLVIIGRESPDPVGPIFQQIVEATKVGLTLDQAMQRAEEDMPTAEFRYFAIVLNIQSQTGGNLADTLQNLASVLRDRKRLRDKIQALSSEAKASAMIIGCLPFLVGSALWILNPSYMNTLFTATAGQAMLLGSAIWMSMGIFIMKQMINFDI
jgi:tight adherence protein B